MVRLRPTSRASKQYVKVSDASSNTHKTHEKAREIESSKVTLVKWTNIVLTTLTSTALVTTIFTSQRALLFVGSVLATLTLAFVIFQLSFDPAKESERHRGTANELWYVREQYINLLADIKSDPGSIDIPRRRDELVDELKRIYAVAPGTSSASYRKAQTALKISGDMTFSNEEIDRFLPDSLHVARRDAEGD
jgi:hypothetical protein